MKWILSSSGPTIQHWTLLHGSPLMELTFNSSTQSVRLITGVRRVFMLEQTGMFRNRIILKTEYSIPVGQIHFVRNNQAGDILIGDEKFYFEIKEGIVYLRDRNRKVLEHYQLELQNEELELSALIFGSALFFQSAYAKAPQLIAL
ncbi:MAG: hypothetical protein ACJ75B_09525 [Flavisolibacter sp.]